MRFRQAARRTTATVAATALVSAGGVLSGLLVGVAGAQIVTAITPTAPLNNGSTTFTISGSGFGTPAAESVVLRKVTAATGQPDITGTVCTTPTCTTAASTPSGATLTVTADLTNAAPGPYDVLVTNRAAVPAPETESIRIAVTAVGNPTLTSVARYTGGTSPADGDLELRGSNLSQGSVVQFLKADGSLDSGLTFVPALGSTSGYVSSTTLRGHYTAASSAAPGLHQLRVVDTNNQASNRLDFYQPVLTGASQSTIGQGATQTAFAAVGQGFNPSSTYTISTPSTTPPSAPDVTVSGPATVTATSVTELVTVTTGAATTARTLTVRGPDGGFATRTDLVSVAAAPKFAAGPPLAAAPLSPSKEGQGGTTDVTVTGTGLTPGTTFDFGAGTGSPLAVKTFTDGTKVVVTVPVAATAPTGARTVVSHNPDGGTDTLANGFTVTAAPTISRLTPASGNPGQAAVSTLVDGTGFRSADSYAVTFSGNPGEITSGTAHYVSATQLSVPVTVAGGAAAGPRDVTVTDTSDGGTSTCAGCFGINSLAVSPGNVSNTGSTTFTLTGTGLAGGTTVRVFLPGQPTPAYQADIPGTGVAPNGSNSITAAVDLTDVAPGSYSVETTTGTTKLSCTGCLAVQATNAPSLASVKPADGGQGATARQVRIDGTYLYPGTSVTFSGTGVTATGVTYHPADANNLAPYLTASVAVAKDATVNTAVAGARDVTVTNLGDGKSGTLPTAFTVNAGPQLTSISPSSLGEGAARDVTLTGKGLQDGSTATFGPGVSGVLKSAAADGTSLVYSVTAAASAPTGPHDVTVVAPDGGQATLAGALTVTSAPVTSAVTPSVAAPGTTTTVTIDATGLQQGVTVAIGGLGVGTPTVAQDGQSLTVTVTVPAGTSLGKRTVTLTNPDGGSSSFGSSPGQSGFVVATVPGAPTGLAVAPGDGTATVTWAAPASDGGSPVTSYLVGDGDAAANTVVQSGSALSATFTGLTNGTTYTFTVAATNAVGTGPAATAQGTPLTVPSAPAAVRAVPQDAQVSVAWTAAAPNGGTVTGYVVHETSGKVADVSVGAVTSAVVTGLTNGTTYSFQVKARNAAGVGPLSAATAGVTPRFASLLTSKRYPSAVTVAGTTVHYVGHLSRSRTGAAIGGARITLSLRPGVGSTLTVALTTDQYGNWSYYGKPVYNTTTSTGFAGDADDAPVLAATYAKGVAPRITVSAPANGSSSSAGSVLVVKGSISPNKSGRGIVLYRVLSGGRLQAVARATVGRTSTWQLSVRPSRGTYVFKVGIGGTTGNTGGYSAAFKVTRT